MIMLGSVNDEGEHGRLLAQPDEIGTRGFLCRDPEGHVWNIGTYNPWDTEALFK